MSKKLHVFNDKWLAHFKWLSPSSDFHRAYCEVCSSSVFVGHSGIWAIIAHAKAIKHLGNLAKSSFRKRGDVVLAERDIQKAKLELQECRSTLSPSLVAESSSNDVVDSSKSCQGLPKQQGFNKDILINTNVSLLKAALLKDDDHYKNNLKVCLPNENGYRIAEEIMFDTKNEKLSPDNMRVGGNSGVNNSSTVIINAHGTSNAEPSSAPEGRPKHDSQNNSKKNSKTFNNKILESSSTKLLGSKCHEDVPADLILDLSSSPAAETTASVKKSCKTDPLVSGVYKKDISRRKSTNRDKRNLKKFSKSSFKLHDVGSANKKRKYKLIIGNKNKPSKSKAKPEKIKKSNVSFSKGKSKKIVGYNEQTSCKQVDDLPKFKLSFPGETVNMVDIHKKNKIKDNFLDANADSITKKIASDTKHEKISHDNILAGRNSIGINSSTVTVNAHSNSNAELTPIAEILPTDSFRGGSEKNNEILNNDETINSTNGTSYHDILINEKPFGSMCHEDVPEYLTLASSLSPVTDTTVRFESQTSLKTVPLVRYVYKDDTSHGKSTHRDKRTLNKSSKSSFKAHDMKSAHKRRKNKFSIRNNKPSKSQRKQEKNKKSNLPKCSKRKSKKNMLYNEQSSYAQIEDLSKFEFRVHSKKDDLVAEPLHKYSATETPLNLSTQESLKYEIQFEKGVNEKANAYKCLSPESLSNTIVDVYVDKMHQNVKEKDRTEILGISPAREHSTTVQSVLQNKSKTIAKEGYVSPALVNVSSVSDFPKQNKTSSFKYCKNELFEKAKKQCEVNTSANKQHGGDKTFKKHELHSTKKDKASLKASPLKITSSYENGKDYYEHLSELDTCFFASTHSQEKASLIKNNIFPKTMKNSDSKYTTITKPTTSSLNNSTKTVDFNFTGLNCDENLSQNAYNCSETETVGAQFIGKCNNLSLNNSTKIVDCNSTLSNCDENTGQSTCKYSETEDVQFIRFVEKQHMSSRNYRSTVPKKEVEDSSSTASQTFSAQVENKSSDMVFKNTCRIPPYIANSTCSLQHFTNSDPSTAVKVEKERAGSCCSSDYNIKTVKSGYVPKASPVPFSEEPINLSSISNCFTPLHRNIFNIKDFRTEINCFANRLLQRKRSFEAECGQILEELELFLNEANAIKSCNASQFDFIDSICDKYLSSPKQNTCMLDVIKLLLTLCNDNPDFSETRKSSEGESFSQNICKHSNGNLNSIPGCSFESNSADFRSSVNSYNSSKSEKCKKKVLGHKKRQHCKPTIKKILTKKKKE